MKRVKKLLTSELTIETGRWNEKGKPLGLCWPCPSFSLFCLRSNVSIWMCEFRWSRLRGLTGIVTSAIPWPNTKLARDSTGSLWFLSGLRRTWICSPVREDPVLCISVLWQQTPRWDKLKLHKYTVYNMYICARSGSWITHATLIHISETRSFFSLKNLL